MSSRLAILIALATQAVNAAECPDLPFCARLRPGAVFFVGEAVEERQLPGRVPEYRFLVREVLTGLHLAPGSELVVVETSEGAPPAGRLLVEARATEDGRLVRDECHYVRPDHEAHQDLALLRHPTALGSLTVRLSPGRDDANAIVYIDGALQRQGTREKHAAGQPFVFTHLPPGDYRINIVAPGYEYVQQREPLAAGACRTVQVDLRGTAVIRGQVRSRVPDTASLTGTRLRLFDYDRLSKHPAGAAVLTSEGHFTFTGVAPGRYFVAPAGERGGVPDRRLSGVIDVAPGVSLTLPPITLP